MSLDIVRRNDERVVFEFLLNDGNTELISGSRRNVYLKIINEYHLLGRNRFRLQTYPEDELIWGPDYQKLLQKLVDVGKARPVFFSTDFTVKEPLRRYGVRLSDDRIVKLHTIKDVLSTLDEQGSLGNYAKGYTPIIRDFLKVQSNCIQDKTTKQAIDFTIQSLYGRGDLWVEVFAQPWESAYEAPESIAKELIARHPVEKIRDDVLEEYVKQSNFTSRVLWGGTRTEPSLIFMCRRMGNMLPDDLFDYNFRHLIINPDELPSVLVSQPELAALEEDRRYFRETSFPVLPDIARSSWNTFMVPSWPYWPSNETVWKSGGQGRDVVWTSDDPRYPIVEEESQGGFASQMIYLIVYGLLYKKAPRIFLPGDYKSKAAQEEVVPEEDQAFMWGEWRRPDEYSVIPDLYPVRWGAYKYISQEVQFAAKAWQYFKNRYVADLIEYLDSAEDIPSNLRESVGLKLEYNIMWHTGIIPETLFEGVAIINEIQHKLGKVNFCSVPPDMDTPNTEDYSYRANILEPATENARFDLFNKTFLEVYEWARNKFLVVEPVYTVYGSPQSDFGYSRLKRDSGDEQQNTPVSVNTNITTFPHTNLNWESFFDDTQFQQIQEAIGRIEAQERAERLSEILHPELEPSPLFNLQNSLNQQNYGQGLNLSKGVQLQPSSTGDFGLDIVVEVEGVNEIPLDENYLDRMLCEIFAEYSNQ